MTPPSVSDRPGSWSEAFERPLSRAWYRRPTAQVARDLLGCWLVRRPPPAWRIARIVETEAYVADDPANHAFRGRTKRNRSMFGPPGTLYVYRIHQVHCANVTTFSGQAVLLRAAAPISGMRGSTSGPGRLCRAFGLTREQDGLDVVTSPELRILPRGRTRLPTVAGPRVGLRRALELPLRFAVSGSAAVSFPRPPGWPRSTRAATR